MKLKKFLKKAVEIPYITVYKNGEVIGQGIKNDILGLGEERIDKFHIYTVEHLDGSSEAITVIEVK